MSAFGRSPALTDGYVESTTAKIMGKSVYLSASFVYLTSFNCPNLAGFLLLIIFPVIPGIVSGMKETKIGRKETKTD